MSLYKVTENPPPFKNGESTVSIADTSLSKPLVSINSYTNKLTNSPSYIIQTPSDAKVSKNIINTTQVINNNTVINQGASGVLYSFYSHSQSINNVNSKIILPFDNVGTEFFTDEVDPSIWNTNTSSLIFPEAQSIYIIRVLFKIQTNTLNATIEISLESNETNDSFIIDNNSIILNELEKDVITTFTIVTNDNIVNKIFNIYIEPFFNEVLQLSNMFLNIIKLR